MKSVVQLTVFGLLLDFVFISQSVGITVQFYRQNEFKGEMYETLANSKCTTLPEAWMRVAGSVKTEGCIEVFKDKNCEHLEDAYLVHEEERYLGSLDDKFKEDPDNPNYYVKSFKACIEYEQRPSTDVEFVDDLNHHTSILMENICSCTTLQISKWEDREGDVYRLDTFGNCVKLFANKNCKGEPSDVIYALRVAWTPAKGWGSIEPCELTTHCHRLDVFVFNMRPLLNLTNLDGSDRKISMAAQQSFFNDGHATVEERYETVKEVSETSTFEISNAIHDTKSTKFSLDVSATFTKSLTNISKASLEIASSFKKTWTKESKQTSSTANAATKKITFRFSRTIPIGPCRVYKAQSFIRFKENSIIDYIIQIAITGSTPTGIQLTADDIQRGLEQRLSTSQSRLTFLPGHESGNEFTLIAETTATFTANLGIETFFESSGKKLWDCANQCGYDCNCSVNDQGSATYSNVTSD